MTTKKLVVAALATSLAIANTTSSMASQSFTPAPVTSASGAWVVWGIFGCSSGIILAAMQKGMLGKGQLTPQEAWTCGLLEFYNAATGKLR